MTSQTAYIALLTVVNVGFIAFITWRAVVELKRRRLYRKVERDGDDIFETYLSFSNLNFPWTLWQEKSQLSEAAWRKLREKTYVSEYSSRLPDLERAEAENEAHRRILDELQQQYDDLIRSWARGKYAEHARLFGAIPDLLRGLEGTEEFEAGLARRQLAETAEALKEVYDLLMTSEHPSREAELIDAFDKRCFSFTWMSNSAINNFNLDLDPN